MSGPYIASGCALLLAAAALTWHGAVRQRNAAREERDIACEAVERQAAEMGALMSALADLRSEAAKRGAKARP